VRIVGADEVDTARTDAAPATDNIPHNDSCDLKVR
jgi:hypothetical protein